MRYICTILISLLFFGSLSAQTIQKGIVTEMNSGNKPIAGAAIIIIGAIPTDSDNDGKFQLSFSKIKPGRSLVVNQIHKDGYELVNEVDVKNWVLSEKNEFKIVLCKEGTLDESRRNFYNIGLDRYYTMYQQLRKQLEVEKKDNKMTVDKYNKQLEKIAGEYERALSELSFYADKFSRINKDDLNTLDAKAISLVEEGQIDEAIKLYEDSNILEDFNSKAAQRDTALYNIETLSTTLLKEVDLLNQKSGEPFTNKADSIYKVLVNQDITNSEYTFRYAMFLQSLDKPEEAFIYYKSALLYSKENEKVEIIVDKLEELYLLIKDEEVVEKFRDLILETLKQKEKNKELESLKKLSEK